MQLEHQAVLRLPRGFVFIAQPQATQLLRAIGDPGQDSQLLGSVYAEAADTMPVPKPIDSSPFGLKPLATSKTTTRSGNADGLLKRYRNGTEAPHEERIEMGGATLEIIGWAEKPNCDAVTQSWSWAMSSKEKRASATEAQGVNHNTYVAGSEAARLDVGAPTLIPILSWAHGSN